MNLTSKRVINLRVINNRICALLCLNSLLIYNDIDITRHFSIFIFSKSQNQQK